MSQPTQYASADGARVLNLCVLDPADKRSTVGTPENYLLTLQPLLHGLDAPRYRSVVAALVIDCNLPVPSSWSRPKTKIQPTTPPASRPRQAARWLRSVAGGSYPPRSGPPRTAVLAPAARTGRPARRYS
jgi:hypothetical protein